MQNAEEADGGSQMLGVGGDLQQGVGAGLEQQAVDLLLVLQGQRREFVRQSEYEMEVAHREQFRLAFGDPLIAGRGLALGAMAIAAGVVRDGDFESAGGTAVAMAAEGGSAAARNGVEDFDMRPVQPAPAAVQ
jgi:hypothetical protein